ncbi:MAG: sulfotransferase domain-containing protein [Gallionella sp.]|jgi:hypothetical protein
MSKKIHLDFLILGAQKSGTTSLHDWLIQHADIRLPALKETHFFSHQSRFEKGMDWYLAQFPVDFRKCTLTGEIDPEYLYIESAVEKIKQLTDANKFIVVLRHPLQRAYSHYLMTVRRGFEDLPFDRAIEAEKERLSQFDNAFAIDHQSYISRSLYSKQISRYFSVFPEGEFLFIKFDDLIDKERGSEVYQRICEFIGTAHDLSQVDRSKSSNQASSPRWEWIKNLIYRKGQRSLLRKVVRGFISDDAKLKLFMFIDRLNQKNLKKYEITPIGNYRLDAKIVSELLEDIDETERLTGLSLQQWKMSLSK